MPYILPQDRAFLDKEIDALAEKITESSKCSEMYFAGLLNYSITKLIGLVIVKLFGKINYGLIATITGVLKNVESEFYRRMVAPYENKKRQENGDIDTYKEII